MRHELGRSCSKTEISFEGFTGDEMADKVVVEEEKGEERKRRVFSPQQKFCVFTFP